MELDQVDKAMLDGKAGPAAQEAMEFLLKLGEAFGADCMVDVHRAHIFADWHTVGLATEIYTRFAEMGAKVKVPTTNEPISVDFEHTEDFSLPAEFIQGQKTLLDALQKMGVMMTHSNTIYLTQNVPRRGENLAWIESSAVGWANAVVGARANREGAISAFMAAVTGRIPKYGLLDDRNRKGEILIEVDPDLFGSLGGRGTWLADFHALGAAIGDIAFDKIPVITGLPGDLNNEQLKAICAMCSPAYTGAHLLLVGISPEAPTVEAAFGGRIPADVERREVSLGDVRKTFESIADTRSTEITGVLTGCPYKTIFELEEVAEVLDGRRVKEGVWVWVTTDPTTRDLARRSGVAQVIEQSGAKLYAGTCHFMQPLADTMGPEQVIATDSVKMPRLLAGPGKPKWVYGTLKDCMEAATTGKFLPSRWT